MKSTCSSRSSRASQSPYTVEKQPKSTPDMYNPTHPIMGRGAHVYIPTWTFIAVATTVYECCEDSDESRSTFLSRSKVRTIITINAFYVTAFLRCRCQRQGLLQTFAAAKVQHFFDMYKFICKNHKKICTFDADLWILGSYQFLWG